MGNRNRNFCNSWKEQFYSKSTQPTGGWTCYKEPWKCRINKSDLSRITSPQYLVAFEMHNSLWQEHHKAPKIEVQQNQYHYLSTLNPWYGLQWQISLLSFFKYKLPKWKTLPQLWNSLFIEIHVWPKGTVCACNATHHHKNSFPSDHHSRLINDHSLKDGLLKCQC